jgi:hypothetical protein
MGWDRWDDNEGRCFVSPPYVVREHRIIDGVTHWRLDGPGLCSGGTDPELLMNEAEQHREHHRRIAVTLKERPEPRSRPTVDPAQYPSELRELRRSARELAMIFASVNPYQHRAIAGSRATLQEVCDQLHQMIEQLP